MPKQSHKYYFFLLIPIISFVIISSAGLWYLYDLNKAAQEMLDKENANAESEPFIYDSSQHEKESLIQDLTDALNNNLQANTFHLKNIENINNKIQTIELDYSKPLRLKLTFTNNKNKLNSIIVGPTIYIQQNNEWVLIKNEDLSNFSQNFFISRSKTNTSLSDFNIKQPQQNEIVTKYNIIKKCLEYKTKYTAQDNKNYDIIFCVNKNKNIKFIKKQTADGYTLQEFSNYNDPIIIERPSVPLLNPVFNLLDEIKK